MSHLICTDCHNMDNRVPNLKDAYKVIKKKFGDDYIDWFDRNAINVYKGRYIDMTSPQMPKKILGVWF